jgi:hypothetical protein
MEVAHQFSKAGVVSLGPSCVDVCGRTGNSAQFVWIHWPSRIGTTENNSIPSQLSNSRVRKGALVGPYLIV